MKDKGRMETEDIILGKAKYEDWTSIYRNVWSRPETCGVKSPIVNLNFSIKVFSSKFAILYLPDITNQTMPLS